MYIFKTKGVCAREIHFDLEGDTIRWVRFVGGGCPGNAEMVSRLLQGQPVDRILPLLQGIPCRNDTSCPDQLARAIELIRTGRLREAEPVTVSEDTEPLKRVAVVAEVDGDLAAVDELCRALHREKIDAVYCLGNLTSDGADNDALLERIRKERWKCVQAPGDRKAAFDEAEGGSGKRPLSPKNRDRLLTLPMLRLFSLGGRKVLAFYDGFFQEMEGFSDYSPYSTEVLMVSNLSEYLTDEEVYPALEAMTEQFSVDMVLFGHTGRNKHVRLGRVDFVNVGGVRSGRTYTVLESGDEGITVSFRKL